jgi:hypothetical protein
MAQPQSQPCSEAPPCPVLRTPINSEVPVEHVCSVCFTSGGVKRFLTATTSPENADIIEELVRDVIASDRAKSEAIKGLTGIVPEAKVVPGNVPDTSRQPPVESTTTPVGTAEKTEDEYVLFSDQLDPEAKVFKL